jgi:PAS domain S-box-containing protein
VTERDQNRVAGTHAVVMASPHGHIQHWDAGAEQLFGYSAVEALGQSLDLIVPAEFRERHWAGLRNAAATGVCKLDRAATNIPVRCKGGTIRAFPVRFVFLQGARNEVVGFAALYSQPAGSEVPFGPIVSL